MTTAYTSLLGLALPVTGELSGTWGDIVNNSITSLLDSSIAGTTNVSTDTDVTLTTTTGAANTAREAILLFSGARTALRTVTAPAQSKIYTVINATTGGYSVKLVGAGPTTGVTIVAGESAVCAWNGSDFIKISNTSGAGTFTNLTVTGTTTLSGLTASTALALDASKNVVSVTNTGTGNNVLSASPTLTGTIGAASLTLSTDLTLSAGTANGVAYLNGSKVVTSGSALTFDGTSVTASQFLDTGFTLADNTDITKKAVFELSGITTGTTRTYTLPDVSGTVALLNGTQTFSSATTFSTTTGTLNFGTSITTGVLTIGGTASTGNLVLGRSTSTQTTSIQAGATASGSTKTINFGTGGLSGSTTAINIGSSVSGASSTTTLNGTVTLANALPTTSGGTGLTSFTANGVVYASSSSELATGSALTFDGTDLATTGGVRLNNSQYYYGKNAAGSAVRLLGVNSGNVNYIGSIDSGPTEVNYGAASTITAQYWNISGSEQMRLTSTGLGIGTSSPAQKLHVANAGALIGLLQNTASTADARYRIQNTGGSSDWGVDGTGTYFQDNNSRPISWFTGGSERMRLDSSGNLGLGVTPTNNTLGKTLQVGQAGAWVAESGTNRWWLASNWYYNSGDKYINNGYATLYSQQNGTHQWQIAASGTAGNAITFTQAMTLDASGNLGIGTTSPSAKLHSSLSSSGATSETLRLDNPSDSANAGTKLTYRISGWSYEGGFVSLTRDGSGGGTIMAFGTSSNASTTNASERARIDSSGNFNIGNSGNFGGKISVAFNPASQYGAYFSPSSGTYTNGFLGFNNSGGSLVGSITTNGSITVYNTTSDYRLKTVVGAVTGHGERIDALEPIEYTWNSNGSRTRGFLAHKFQEVYADSVTGSKDAVDADGKPVYQSMQASTSEVIADLVAEIQSLRKRLSDAGL